MSLKVSVLSSVFNRGELLDRALATYSKQTLDFRYWEYILVDDGSSDSTREVAEKWASFGLPIRILDASKDLGCHKEPGKWRDGSKPRNAGSIHCNGEALVCTHPEIMVPPDALEIAYESVRDYPNDWHTAIPYWLPPADVDTISWLEATHGLKEQDSPMPPVEVDNVGWRTGLPALRTLPGFYSDNWPEHVEGPDYRNQNQERRRTWESEVWFAIDMALWRKIGGFREFDVWGPVDMDFMNRRRAIGIPTRILTSAQSEAPSGNLMVYHQWHEAPRNMELAMETLRQEGADYPNAESAVSVGALRVVYWSGPRERGDDTRAIMGDHVDRYIFASDYCADLRVLDAPCGTGYGSEYLEKSYRYVGLDIDSESIRWAKNKYGRPGVEFYQGDMLALPFPDATFDRFLCFEGIEHIANQEGFALQVRRILKSGGTFIISTPQQGATPGTPWDRYMLSPQKLMNLFASTGFVNLEWFHQQCYGGAPGMNPVRAGLSADAQLMVLGGTKI